MLLTRIWGVILACLATFFLAGMFLVAAGDDEDFAEADQSAIRAITEAGLAALEAQIVGHPVEQTSAILYNPRIQERLVEGEDAVDAGQLPLGEVVADLTEGLRLRTSDSSLTAALINAEGEVKASNGASLAHIPEVVTSDEMQQVAPDAEALMSISLDGQLYVVKVSKADAKGNRMLGLGQLDTGAGSMFRRVLGSSSPAALVRKGKQLGDIIGGQPVTAEIEALAKAHVSDAPTEGASKAFTVGEGMDARIGSLGRIPGPAGRGKNGVLLVVLSGKTAAAGHQDLATALRRAREDNGVAKVNVVMLLGLLAVTAGLAIYLPTLEGTSPLGRLTREFQAMSQGSQHALFHDRYGGPFGELARSANTAHEALRQAYLAELEIEEEEFEANPTAPRQRPATTRVRRATRSHRPATSDTGRRTTGSGKAAGGRRLRSSKSSAPVDPATDLTAAAPPLAPATPAAPAVSTPTPPAAAPVPEPSAAMPVPEPSAAIPIAEPSAAMPVPEPSATIPISEPSGMMPAPPVAPAPPTPFTPPPALEIDDPNAPYYREVYEEFLQVKQACGESTANFTFDKFAKKLAKQTSDIKKKRAGVADVRFTVYVKDGKAALRAKVIKA